MPGGSKAEGILKQIKSLKQPAFFIGWTKTGAGNPRGVFNGPFVGAGVGRDCGNVHCTSLSWAQGCFGFLHCRQKRSALFMDKQSQVCEQEMVLFKKLEKRSGPSKFKLT